MKFTLSPQFRSPECPRQRAIERWALRQLGILEHERRVRSVAARLFDLTRPLHGLSRRHRELLCLAALVHDVGRSIDDETHPRQGARLLRDATRLPLDAAERRALMYLTRYHRGAAPEQGRDRILAKDDDSDSMRVLLALLKAADSLDGRTLESPRLVFALRGGGRRIDITCYLDALTPKACKTYGRAKKFRLLEELLDVRVSVTVEQARAVRMVA